MFVFPASFAQQRFWLLGQLEGSLVPYNLADTRCGWGGRWTPKRCAAALETIVAAARTPPHELPAQDGEPVQVVSPPRRHGPAVLRSAALPHGEREAAVAAQRRAESARPFDFAPTSCCGPKLLRLAEEEHVLLLTLHHIAADGWSIRLLWRELDTLYDAYRRQAEPALPELPIQYVDFTVWQRNELQGERKERLLAYWRTQIERTGGVGVAHGPSTAATTIVSGSTPATSRCRRNWPTQLRQLGRSESVTLHMTLLAAFQTLLARYSGQEDIAVGMPIAGRQQAELEQLIGFFVNTLVLRTDLSGQPTFRELLARVRRVSLDAYEHQDLPFEKLVEELDPERHLDRSPLFQVCFKCWIFRGVGLPCRDWSGMAGQVWAAACVSIWKCISGLNPIRAYGEAWFTARTCSRRRPSSGCSGTSRHCWQGIVADPDSEFRSCRC